MSVYTRVEPPALEAFLRGFAVGELQSYEGIVDGIDNTNYFVTTTGGNFVLTLFEHYGDEELNFFLELLAVLAEHSVPCAHPVANRAGDYLQHLCGKPAALLQRLPGRSVTDPTATQCAGVGRALAQIHIAGADVPQHRDNPRGLAWFAETAARVLPILDGAAATLLREELAFQQGLPVDGLPRGVVHADLFRDNALFQGEELAGVIDFYAAGDDLLLYDLAICANDWCIRADTSLDRKRLGALLSAYAEVRPLLACERVAWAAMLRRAALRFWLSRLYDKHFPRAGDITHIKDPAHFEQLLRSRLEAGSLPDDCWPRNARREGEAPGYRSAPA